MSNGNKQKIYYAVTSYSVQGETHDNVIAVMNSKTVASTHRAFYVNISRARYQAEIITDDATRLHKTLLNETNADKSLLQIVRENQDHFPFVAEKSDITTTHLLAKEDAHFAQKVAELRDAITGKSYDERLEELGENPI